MHWIKVNKSLVSQHGYNIKTGANWILEQRWKKKTPEELATISKKISKKVLEARKKNPEAWKKSPEENATVVAKQVATMNSKSLEEKATSNMK